MYSREHILWLENFEAFKLNKDQKAVIVLGYGERSLSANDIIKEVGIVDIEEFRKLRAFDDNGTCLGKIKPLFSPTFLFLGRNVIFSFKIVLKFIEFV